MMVPHFLVLPLNKQNASELFLPGLSAELKMVVNRNNKIMITRLSLAGCNSLLIQRSTLSFIQRIFNNGKTYLSKVILPQLINFSEMYKNLNITSTFGSNQPFH